LDQPIQSSLHECPTVASALWDWCDFEMVEVDNPDWFALATGDPFHVIARDGAGGRFCIVEQAGSHVGALLYVSSEGEAGTIAPSLADGLAIMVALPYWRDCLKFSAGGDLKQMQRAQVRCEADLRRKRPNVDAIRHDLYQALGLALPVSPLETLHRAVAQGKVMVVGTTDGSPFSSLFNSFTVDHNPLWRRLSP
jgi:hypothetical protein